MFILLEILFHCLDVVDFGLLPVHLLEAIAEPSRKELETISERARISIVAPGSPREVRALILIATSHHYAPAKPSRRFPLRLTERVEGSTITYGLTLHPFRGGRETHVRVAAESSDLWPETVRTHTLQLVNSLRRAFGDG